MKHDYGLKRKEELALSNYYWQTVPHKKVILCNVKLCKNRITVDKIAKRLKKLGAPQLELAEAVWLTETVVEAIKNEQDTADISRMFNIQVAIYNLGIIPREAIAEKLYEVLFKKIDENDEEITVNLNWWCLI